MFFILGLRGLEEIREVFLYLSIHRGSDILRDLLALPVFPNLHTHSVGVGYNVRACKYFDQIDFILPCLVDNFRMSLAQKRRVGVVTCRDS